MEIARRALRALGALAVMPAVLAVAASAHAAAPAPHWLMISQPAPTYFHAGDTSDFYWVMALNDGGVPTTGKVTFKDTLPAGLVVTSVAASAGNEQTVWPLHSEGMECTITGGSLQTVECTSEISVPVGDRVIARIDVEVPPGTNGPLHNAASIEGGGAPEESATGNSTLVVEPSQQVPYGVQLETEATQEDGRLATQASSHPFAFSTMLASNVAKVNPQESGAGCDPANAVGQEGCAELVGAAKDIEVKLPPGLVGDPLSTPRCSQEQFQKPGDEDCPASTQVGGAYFAFFGRGTAEQYAPVYNVEPPPGQPAELGFTVGGAGKVPMFFHLRSDGDYGLTVHLNEIANFDAVRLAALMVWGVPAAAAHDPMRQSRINGCSESTERFGCPSDAFPVRPFLTMPSRCDGQPLGLPTVSDSWETAGTMVSGSPEASLAALTGCEALAFTPDLGVESTTHQGSAPAGYTVNLKVPQTEGPYELATPDVRNVEVALPEGTTLSPSATNGLLACSDEQFGLHSGAEGSCPRASTIGTVKVTSPLLEKPLSGEVYAGQPECAPCGPVQADAGQMVRLFMQIQGSGLLIKLAGHTKIDQATGRLTTVFTENPQLPFSDFELSLEPGPDAPLVNPSTCGTATTAAQLTPWSTMSPAKVSADMQITGCGPQGFGPSFVAGMTKTAQAGAFSGFSVKLSRKDGEQTLGSISVTTPPGLLGIIKNVAQCPEAQANAGTCPASSQIGSSAVTVGPGSQPHTITGGKVYLTGPYHGAPFGLSIVTPAQAGPFTLSGNTGAGTEVVRAAIAIDTHTAQVHVTSDSLPTVLDGIPLNIRQVVVNIDREGFMFNPTDCNALAVGGTLTSSSGTNVGVSYPFQSVNCVTLGFKPKLTASTQGKTSKAAGASLAIKVTPMAGQANIGKVRLVFPKQLPARLTTLQKACTDAVFNANPSACPAASAIGTAVARTPVLANPLTGPIYLVSHGGEAFPDAVIVLQGEGITLYLDGNTNIKKGITSSTFNSVPDAPVSSFEAKLPEGPHSVFGTDIPAKAKGSLCAQGLKMPTTMTGQNGAVLTQTTKIAITGCPKKKVKKGKKAASIHHGKGKITKKK
jgi:uncharacterized repeat protein (TIGR01451 family)